MSNTTHVTNKSLLTHVAQIKFSCTRYTWLHIDCLTQAAKSVFPEVAQNSLRTPYSVKSPEYSRFPGLWPP